MKHKHSKKALFCLLGLLGMIAVTDIIAFFANRNFTVTRYNIASQKIPADAPICIALLADMHQTEYGRHNEDLIKAIKEQEPDLIVIAGDGVNKRRTDTDYIVELCTALTDIAPVYYGLGNHENEVIYGNDLSRGMIEEAGLDPDSQINDSELITDGSLLEAISAAGARILKNESELIEINGNKIKIGGINTNKSSFWSCSGQFIYDFEYQDEDAFKILISHRPETVMRYISSYSIDLVLSGHNHGGQVRLPYLGGLISSDWEMFPEYDSGYFNTGNLRLIVSRGLSSSGIIPRINNCPELVIININ